MTGEGRPGVVSKYDVDLSGAVWGKSRRSSTQGPNCVEVARVGGVYAVRDSKHPHGAPLVFDRDEWRAFLDGVKSGEFDGI